MKKMSVIVFSLLIVVGFAGCGSVDRGMASITGTGTETCVDGVLYLQFTSGVTVKYNQNGSVATCSTK
jgi:uncharacterized protein YceK